jgi:hypothetical protein
MSAMKRYHVFDTAVWYATHKYTSIYAQKHLLRYMFHYKWNWMDKNKIELILISQICEIKKEREKILAISERNNKCFITKVNLLPQPLDEFQELGTYKDLEQFFNNWAGKAFAELELKTQELFSTIQKWRKEGRTPIDTLDSLTNIHFYPKEHILNHSKLITKEVSI